MQAKMITDLGRQILSDFLHLVHVDGTTAVRHRRVPLRAEVLVLPMMSSYFYNAIANVGLNCD